MILSFERRGWCDEDQATVACGAYAAAIWGYGAVTERVLERRPSTCGSPAS
jgi:hypothetical protein